jgi:pimeloyl-ACP methyl ester carboxylesterase
VAWEDARVGEWPARSQSIEVAGERVAVWDLPDATLAWIDGTGHHPQAEDPEGWLTAVLPGLENPASAEGSPV